MCDLLYSLENTVSPLVLNFKYSPCSHLFVELVSDTAHLSNKWTANCCQTYDWESHIDSNLNRNKHWPMLLCFIIKNVLLYWVLHVKKCHCWGLAVGSNHCESLSGGAIRYNYSKLILNKQFSSMNDRKAAQIWDVGVTGKELINTFSSFSVKDLKNIRFFFSVLRVKAMMERTQRTRLIPAATNAPAAPSLGAFRNARLALLFLLL